MMHKLLMRFTRGMPARAIRRDGTPYLERYYVGTLLGRTFYLHRFLGGDVDADAHDHPWRVSWSLMLCGAYVEQRLEHLDPQWGVKLDVRARMPGSLTRIRGRDFHRIWMANPNTWTLFVTSARCKGWGFLQTLSDPAGGYKVVYHQPLDVAKNFDWHLTAPKGAELRATEKTE